MSALPSMLAAACLLAAVSPPIPGTPATGAGQAIYLRGELPSGAQVSGTREGGLVSSGLEAACVNCHQRSGLGTIEGRQSVPPVAGDYLFHSRAQAADEPELRYVESLHGNRDPYSEATLARAIREGLDSQGRPLSYLMPRYALGDQDMAALIAYLKTLGPRQVPGVTETVLHFATIVTPDADPVKRRGMLDVLEKFVSEKNLFPFKPTPKMRTSGKTQYVKSMYMANRRWQLHVWELTGPPAGWGGQLDKHLEEEPVYAVLSGLGRSHWEPVHAFCERHEVPCLFPNIEVPVVAERDFYPLYFSKGVLLEAELVARDLLGPAGRPGASAVEQVYRSGDSGERAAEALAALLTGHGVKVHSTALAAKAEGKGLEAVHKLLRQNGGRGAALVLWLRPADVVALGNTPPAEAKVYLSGLLGGLEKSPLPAAWRRMTLVTFPFDLPSKRGVRLNYPLGWFSFRHVALVAEQVQTDTYLACSLLADVLNRSIADNFVQPYLVEQLQGMLEHRIITGYYPRLTLASNQRFASKGGYLARFKEPSGPALLAEGEWTVP